MNELIKDLAPELTSEMERVTVKKLKSGFGHDGGGYSCDVYLDNKKVGSINDDGWGGDAIVNFEDKKLNIFTDFLTKNNIAKIMFDNDWDFMETIEKINIDFQIEYVIGDAINRKEIEKEEKKLSKLFDRAIVFGTKENYKYYSVKRISLEDIISNPKGGLKVIQKWYDLAKATGEEVLNTNLKELGIKL